MRRPDPPTTGFADLLSHLAEVETFLFLHGPLALCRGVESPGPHPNLPDGRIARHIRDLYRAETSAARTDLEQAFEAELHGAVQELTRRLARLTELYVLPAIERRPCHAAA
jgi:hypothetical protein